MFDSPDRLALGLFTGVLFGFLLQKGRVAKFETILGQLLLKDWTVVKVMATAVVVGSVGVHVLVANGWASMHVKPFLPGGVLLGALAFGVGMAVYGYCPGTGVAACGEGNRDAMTGVAGMLAGAGVFVAFFPSLQPVMNALGHQGATTLPEIFGVSPWLVIAAMAAGVLVVLMIVERWTEDKPMGREFSSTHGKPVAG
jgi:uncharacterized membrane protein YedE/YeeE